VRSHRRLFALFGLTSLTNRFARSDHNDYHPPSLIEVMARYRRLKGRTVPIYIMCFTGVLAACRLGYYDSMHHVADLDQEVQKGRVS
jgi:hypothetical protein